LLQSRGLNEAIKVVVDVFSTSLPYGEKNYNLLLQEVGWEGPVNPPCAFLHEHVNHAALRGGEELQVCTAISKRVFISLNSSNTISKFL
jgi:hypothetical protein